MTEINRHDTELKIARTANSTYNLCRASRSFKYVRTFVHLTSRTAAQVVAAKRYNQWQDKQTL
jgi:hypothetical protein